MLDDREVLFMINRLYEELEYNELYDALSHYMHCVVHEYYIDRCMFADEIENLAGFRDHDDIVNYIVATYNKVYGR